MHPRSFFSVDASSLFGFVVIFLACFSSCRFGASVYASDELESDGVELQCEEHTLRCSDGSRCYEEGRKCDAFSDCPDGSDESECSEGCDAGYFKCLDDGMCIPNNYLCDGSPDCGDESDEARCNRNECVASEFTCVSDGRCIPDLLKCDAVAHCADRSDEDNCTELDLPSSCELRNAFDCMKDDEDSVECISSDMKCNGNPDCSNGADESDYLCSVPKDAVANATVLSCQDSEGWCAQDCEDTEAGYRCTCHDGYLLSYDNHTCVVDDGEEETLWVTDGNTIIKYESPLSEVAVKLIKQIDAISYDFAENKTFYMSINDHSIGWLNDDGSGSQALINDIKRPAALAYDWTDGTLYWSDTNKIDAFSVPNDRRRTLFAHPDVSDVTALAVDPRQSQRFVYWGQGKASSAPGIYRAPLHGEGSKPDVLVQASVEQPVAMTIDFSAGNNGKLVWLDSHRRSIMSLDVVTHELKSLHAIQGQPDPNHLMGLAVSSEMIYWVNRASKTIFSIQKASIRVGEEVQEDVFTSGFDVPKCLLVHHRSRQPTDPFESTVSQSSTLDQTSSDARTSVSSGRGQQTKFGTQRPSPAASHESVAKPEGSRTTSGGDANAVDLPGSLRTGESQSQDGSMVYVIVGVAAGVLVLCAVIAVVVVVKVRANREQSMQIDQGSQSKPNQMDSLLRPVTNGKSANGHHETMA